MRKKLLKVVVVLAIIVGIYWILPKKEDVITVPVSRIDIDASGNVSQTSSTGLLTTGNVYPATLVTDEKSVGDINDESGCGGFYVVQPIFKESFVKTYKYEDSKNYCFATKMFINDVDVGYLYTYRNKNNGVSNDFDLELGGCFAAYDIRNSNPTLALHLGSTIKVANKKNSYGYHTYKMPDTNAGITNIRFQSSPVKETTDVMDYDVQFYSECN